MNVLSLAPQHGLVLGEPPLPVAHVRRGPGLPIRHSKASRNIARFSVPGFPASKKYFTPTIGKIIKKSSPTVLSLFW